MFVSCCYHVHTRQLVFSNTNLQILVPLVKVLVFNVTVSYSVSRFLIKLQGRVHRSAIHHITFIISVIQVDTYGTVQPHTLIRQHLDYHHWYDRAKLSLKEVHNCQYVACMNPTAGSFTINPRLQVSTKKLIRVLVIFIPLLYPPVAIWISPTNIRFFCFQFFLHCLSRNRTHPKFFKSTELVRSHILWGRQVRVHLMKQMHKLHRVLQSRVKLKFTMSSVLTNGHKYLLSSNA